MVRVDGGLLSLGRDAQLLHLLHNRHNLTLVLVMTFKSVLGWLSNCILVRLNGVKRLICYKWSVVWLRSGELVRHLVNFVFCFLDHSVIALHLRLGLLNLSFLLWSLVEQRLIGLTALWDLMPFGLLDFVKKRFEGQLITFLSFEIMLLWGLRGMRSRLCSNSCLRAAHWPREDLRWLNSLFLDLS